MSRCSLFCCVDITSFLMALGRKSSCGKSRLRFHRQRRQVLFEPGCCLGLVCCFFSLSYKYFIINLVSDKQWIMFFLQLTCVVFCKLGSVEEDLTKELMVSQWWNTDQPSRSAFSAGHQGKEGFQKGFLKEAIKKIEPFPISLLGTDCIGSSSWSNYLTLTSIPKIQFYETIFHHIGMACTIVLPSVLACILQY